MLMEMLHLKTGDLGLFFRVKISENASLQFIHKSHLNRSSFLTTQADFDSDSESKITPHFHPISVEKTPTQSSKTPLLFFLFLTPFEGLQACCLSAHSFVLDQLTERSVQGQVGNTTMFLPGFPSPSSPSFFPLNRNPPTHSHPPRFTPGMMRAMSSGWGLLLDKKYKRL